MDIQIQFEVILTSFFFGFLFMIIYDLLNCFLYKKKGKFIRLIIETSIFLVLTLPIYINCILLIMPTATMQLLMSSSYILLIPFLFSIENNNEIYKIITIVLISLLIRNYTIQANATYKSLEITHNKILTIVIGNAAYNDHV